MTRASAIARGRAVAEAGMVDACTIQVKTGSVTDQDSGVVTPAYDTLYAGKCRFQQAPPNATVAPDVGEGQVYLVQAILQLPMTVTGVEPEALVTCTASALDPDLPGRTWLVRAVGRKTHATARRLELQEVSG